MSAKSCGKVRFQTRGLAEWALQKIRREPARSEKKPCRSYLCPMCKGWHLTSEPK